MFLCLLWYNDLNVSAVHMMCQIIFLVGESYSGYQLRYFTFQYSLSLPTRAGFLQLREYASAAISVSEVRNTKQNND